MSCGQYRKNDLEITRQPNGDIHILIRDKNDRTVAIAGENLTLDEYTQMLSHFPIADQPESQEKTPEKAVVEDILHD